MLKLPPGRFTISGQRSQSRNELAEIGAGRNSVADGFTTAIFCSVGSVGLGASPGGGGAAAATGWGVDAAGWAGAGDADLGGLANPGVGTDGRGAAPFFVSAGGPGAFEAVGGADGGGVVVILLSTGGAAFTGAEAFGAIGG